MPWSNLLVFYNISPFIMYAVAISVAKALHVFAPKNYNGTCWRTIK